LPSAELQTWYDKRNAVNRYFAALGYKNINVNRKPWCEGPYGREMQSVKLHKPNHRNWLTTDATARVLTEIATGKAVTAERSKQMMELLKRRPFDKNAESQSREYTGKVLPDGAKLWSKAGWTSETRHDAAYVELPGRPALRARGFHHRSRERARYCPVRRACGNRSPQSDQMIFVLSEPVSACGQSLKACAFKRTVLIRHAPGKIRQRM
jgi:hypothetical protein